MFFALFVKSDDIHVAYIQMFVGPKHLTPFWAERRPGALVVQLSLLVKLIMVFRGSHRSYHHTLGLCYLANVVLWAHARVERGLHCLLGPWLPNRQQSLGPVEPTTVRNFKDP